MGYPGKNHKSYQTPKRPFEKTRIEEETRMVIEFGLRNKREVWKAHAALRRYRKAARELLGLSSAGVEVSQFEAKKGELIEHMQRMGLLGPDADIDDVLSLKTPQHLERRLRHSSTVRVSRVAETGETVHHPWPYRDRRKARFDPGLPGEPERGDTDLVLREVTGRRCEPRRTGKDHETRREIEYGKRERTVGHCTHLRLL
jgi:ribosomal protein uS4